MLSSLSINETLNLKPQQMINEHRLGKETFELECLLLMIINPNLKFDIPTLQTVSRWFEHAE